MALARLLLQSTPGEQCSETLLLPPPTPQTLKTLPLPQPLASVRFEPPGLSSGSDQRWIRGCGTGWLLAGPDSLPLWLCRVSMLYVLLCCWGVFPVLTLYSPRSIVWALFFFSSLSSCLYCIFLQFYLHFTTDYTLYDCVNIDFSLTGILCVCVCVCVCVCRWCKRGKQAFGPKHCEAREGETQDVSKLNAIFAPIALFYYLHNYLKYKTLLFIMHLFLFLGETTLR